MERERIFTLNNCFITKMLLIALPANPYHYAACVFFSHSYLIFAYKKTTGVCFTAVRDITASGVKNKRALEGVSAFTCLPRARITGENVRYVENLWKTCMKCLNPGTFSLLGSKKKISMQKLGEHSSNHSILYVLLFGSCTQSVHVFQQCSL